MSFEAMAIYLTHILKDQNPEREEYLLRAYNPLYEPYASGIYLRVMGFAIRDDEVRERVSDLLEEQIPESWEEWGMKFRRGKISLQRIVVAEDGTYVNYTFKMYTESGEEVGTVYDVIVLEEKGEERT